MKNITNVYTVADMEAAEAKFAEAIAQNNKLGDEIARLRLENQRLDRMGAAAIADRECYRVRYERTAAELAKLRATYDAPAHLDGNEGWLREMAAEIAEAEALAFGQ